ncbi:hypothetical protein ACWAT4_21495 [Bradyrhizobium manausense]
MTEKTDWMWVYENPKEAAAEIDRLRAAMQELIDDPFMDPEGTRQFCLKALGQSVRDTP